MKKLISLLLVFAMLVCYIPVNASAADELYVVAGVEGLCGSAWNPGDLSNAMVRTEEGLYELTYYGVPAGTYEFKVTNGTWDQSWGDNGNNYVIEVSVLSDVTIVFDAEAKDIAVAIVEQEYYSVAGTEELCGSAWNPGDISNAMFLNGDGIFVAIYPYVPAGHHEFKVTNGTWDQSWGDNGNNYAFELDAASEVVIEFYQDTKEIRVCVFGLYYVAGTGSLCGSDWNPGDPANMMTRDGDLRTITYTSVPAGTHEFKVTNGTWDRNWGMDGNNYVLELADESNVTVIFNTVTEQISVEVTKVEPYYVAGTGDLCGVDWDPGYADNKMALDFDGTYFKTFLNVPAGRHEFKITNGTWDRNWGDNGNNYVMETDAAYDITVIFDPEAESIGYMLSEPTILGPVDPVVYDIAINVHYYREDGDYSDWEVHMWNGVESLSSTRKFEEGTVEYEGKQWKVATYYADASDTWVGFIIKTPAWTKDPDGDRHIDISDVIGGVVNVYAVSGSALEDFVTSKDEAVIGAKVTAAVYDYKTSTITVTTSAPIDELSLDTFRLESPDGAMTISAVEAIDELNYKVTYEGIIDEMSVYTLYYNETPCVVTIPNTYSTEEFEAEFTYAGDDLGAAWTKDATTFRLWAPTAAAVSVNLYSAGNDGEKIDTVEMTKDVNGTWVVTVEGDLNGTYYTYSVTRKGETVEAVDPYARTTGVNGNRAMVIDLDSTDPEGWAEDTYVTVDNYTDAVIWELHVRDFSIDASSGMENKGKYLAFTENGTTVPGTDIATGVDYMVDLGVNYVHLLPVYDINSVDETTGGYNWGYDPKNYNVPEGSYSTDPYNGAVRVNEFKQMVQSLHDAGIGVVMDVVYNHVADAGQFCFNQIVPGYFSRIHDDGAYQSNSGCGNDTASERSMVRKYIVDSVLYWAEEYHIDGFRWDLVGLIDYETINQVMEEVHKVNPNIIFYGEGWEMCQWTTKDGYVDKMTIQNNDKLVNTEAGIFSFFNDTIRNVIHGGVFTATDKGFVSGCGTSDTRRTVVDGYMGYSVWGSAGQRVDTPLQTINYASCHDNYTLFDNLTIDVMDAEGCTAEEARAQAAAMNNLAAAYYITAQGVPFIHAGEEMLRSKPDAAQENGFNHNSYSAGDEINSIKWSTLADATVAQSHDYYQGLIAFRAAHPALRMTEQAEILGAMEVIETDNTNQIIILNRGGNGEDAEILTILNTGSYDIVIDLPAGLWNVYVNQDKAGTEVLQAVRGKIRVAPTSATILVKASEEEFTNPFTDVAEGSYYFDSVLWAAEVGITTGTTETTFAPNAEATRAQILTFLWRAAGSPEPGIRENPFTDVAEDSYYFKAVLWALEKGITTGVSETRFAPNKICTRAEAVTFLWRNDGSDIVIPGVMEPYDDVPADAYYRNAVNWAYLNCITQGTGERIFSPNRTCTRGQIVTFLYRELFVER